jgi:hypothetical protein
MVDASPEKAGVGGSIPSLATIRISSLQVINHKLPFGRLSRIFAKFPVMNNMTLLKNGRVLVVRGLADWRLRSNSLGMCKMGLLQKRDASPSRLLSWFVGYVLRRVGRNKRLSGLL